MSLGKFWFKLVGGKTEELDSWGVGWRLLEENV